MRSEVREVLSSKNNALANNVNCGKMGKVFLHFLVSHTTDSDVVDLEVTSGNCL